MSKTNEKLWFQSKQLHRAKQNYACVYNAAGKAARVLHNFKEHEVLYFIRHFYWSNFLWRTLYGNLSFTPVLKIMTCPLVYTGYFSLKLISKGHFMEKYKRSSTCISCTCREPLCLDFDIYWLDQQQRLLGASPEVLQSNQYKVANQINTVTLHFCGARQRCASALVMACKSHLLRIRLSAHQFH